MRLGLPASDPFESSDRARGITPAPAACLFLAAERPYIAYFSSRHAAPEDGVMTSLDFDPAGPED